MTLGNTAQADQVIEGSKAPNQNLILEQYARIQ
jgi:hypothetical protein